MGRMTSHPVVWVLLLSCLLTMLELSAAQSSNRQGSRSRTSSKRPSPTRSSKQARSSRCKDKTTFRFSARDLRRKPFSFKCPKGPVAEVNAVGVKGKCRGYSPYLQMTADRCAWNATCTVPYKGKPLETAATGTWRRNCVGQVPDKLEISYTCLKKKAEVSDLLGKFKKTKKRMGIVRSHRLFPWTYRNGDQLGNLTFARPRKPVGLTNLWFTVRSLAILSSDLVFLSWKDNSNRRQVIDAVRVITTNDTTFKLDNVESVILTFYANYENHYTRIEGEEKGFVFCYQWLKASGKPRKGSACTKVMYPAKCRSKGGSGRKRGNPTGKNRRGQTRSGQTRSGQNRGNRRNTQNRNRQQQ